MRLEGDAARLGPVLVRLIAAGLFGCLSKPRELLDDDAENLTVGTVEREIVIGMDTASVAEALGSRTS
jgi:hypothetical protein